nr:PRAME family member 22-like [Aotus nancymaae]
MKMDQKAPATLLELAAWGLLSEELAAIHALEELPWGLYVPLFIIAFLGGQKMKLKAMVRIWPSRCLRVGPLSVQSHTTKSWEPRLTVCISSLPRTLPLGNPMYTRDIVSHQEGMLEPEAGDGLTVS